MLTVENMTLTPLKGASARKRTSAACARVRACVCVCVCVIYSEKGSGRLIDL